MALNLTCINGTNYNCTSGNCTPCSSPAKDAPFSIFSQIRIIIYALAFLLSLIGNGCVILVTLKRFLSKTPITAFSTLLAHLAFVDFLFSCNAFVLIPNEIHNQESFDSIAICTVKKLMRQVPLMAAIGTITVIAVERYLGITSHYTRKWTHKRVFVCLVVIWIISFAVYIPNVSVIVHKQNNRDCIEKFSRAGRIAQACFLCLVEYIGPLIIIAYCNYKIIKVIKGRECDKLGIAKVTKAQQDEQKKTVRILIAIVIAFAIICLPNQILFLYLDFTDRRYKPDKAWDILQVFGVLLLLHTSFNPAVYSILDKKFRADARTVCCCCCPKDILKKRASSSSSSSGATKSSALSTMKREAVQENAV